MSVQGFHMAVQRPLEIKYHRDRDSVMSEGTVQENSPKDLPYLSLIPIQTRKIFSETDDQGVCALSRWEEGMRGCEQKAGLLLYPAFGTFSGCGERLSFAAASLLFLRG